MFGHDDDHQQGQGGTFDPNNQTNDQGQPEGDMPGDAPGAPAGDTAQPSGPPAGGGAPANDNLLNIKRDALAQLAPLVSHLDQSPEEKFKTTMMMIQATDDSKLIQAAYDAAKAIPDEKARAEALLDIVNEINYFTQQHNAQ